MDSSDTFPSPPLRALYRHPDIRAVVRIDDDGQLLEHIGQALSLRPQALAASTSGNSDEPEESLYIRVIEDDYLIVVFEEDSDFEPLKTDVDETLARQLGNGRG